MSKYCVLPGQEPVRLASLSGHVILIGENPRDIPEEFLGDARAAGCLSEEELEGLKLRLLGGTKVPPASIADPPQTSPTNLEKDEDSFPSPPGSLESDSDRAEKIKAAVIELINAGNPNDFTGNGVPKVEALKEKLGFEVSAPERDSAYAAAKG
jgi:hypothetical protein